MAAIIDLRKDLPKVRAQYARVLKALETQACDYTAPCVIGAMVNPKKRRQLQDAENLFDTNDSMVGTLLNKGLLRAPREQHRDLTTLQSSFDSGDRAHFERTLASIEKKYLAERMPA
jgi:hypothetical protein